MRKRKKAVLPTVELNHRIELITEVEHKMYFSKGCYKAAAGRCLRSFKMCSVCHFEECGLKLSDRIWTCPNCGNVHDRYVNTSKNLKQLASNRTALTVVSGSDVSSTLSDGKVAPVKYGTVCKKDQGRKKIVHFCALSG